MKLLLIAVVAGAALLHCGQALPAELTDTESKLLDLMLKDLLEAKREDTDIEAERSGTYPGYAGGPDGAPPGGQDPLYGYFSAVAGQDQQIDALELQRCLTSSGIAGTYEQFSLETSRIMIAMLDRDYSGHMGFNEFKELWAALNQWKTTFMTYDRDRSGTVDPNELHQAISSWGYNLSPQALNIISKRYSTNGHVTFDEFIAVAIRLRMLTDHFRRRDTAQNGIATFTYDDFIQVAMYT